MEGSLKTLKLPIELGCPMYTECLVKKNQGNNADLPNGRTLFVTRLDNRITDKQLKNAFSQFGNVIKATIKATAKPANHDALKEENIVEKTTLGHVVFESSETVNEILSLAGTALIASKGAVGLRRRTLEEMIPAALYYAEPRLLKQALDDFMMEYDVEKEKERMEEDMLPDVDDEGFVRVKNYSNPNRGVPHRVELGSALVVQDSDEMKKRKKKEEKRKRMEEGLDFYKFQLKERTKEQIAAARQQQAKDESTLQELRKRKKFSQKE